MVNTNQTDIFQILNPQSHPLKQELKDNRISIAAAARYADRSYQRIPVVHILLCTIYTMLHRKVNTGLKNFYPVLLLLTKLINSPDRIPMCYHFAITRPNKKPSKEG
jgi:hypothetical protein